MQTASIAADCSMEHEQCLILLHMRAGTMRGVTCGPKIELSGSKLCHGDWCAHDVDVMVLRAVQA